MGYLDALTSSHFKTAQDGRKVFFPWGILGRGYAIDSERDFKQLQRQIKTYMVVSLVLIIGIASVQGDLAGFVSAVLLIVFYALWVRYPLRRMRRSEERLSVQDSMTSRARALGATGLWLVEIVALAFVCFGILILFVGSGNKLAVLAAIVFFGFVAAKVGVMLFLRRRHSTMKP